MKTRTALLCITLVATALAVPAGAHAASGEATLELGGSALKGLKAQKVKLKAIAPAKLRSDKLTLPVGGGVISDTAVLAQQGSLRLTRGARKVTISSLRVTVGLKPTVSGRIDNRAMTLFTIAVPANATLINQIAGIASLKTGRLRLTAAAATAIRKKLRLRRAVGRGFGAVNAVAQLTAAGTGATGTPGTGTGAVDGLPVLARPATAVDITAATIDWHVRDSFIDYVSSGEGVSPIAPGTALGKYDFRMPQRTGGWYDPVSNTADVLGGGGVRFRYSGHGIDISTYEPEIEINGASSRAIFKFGDGKRGVLIDLNLAAVTPSIAGTTRTYTSIPGLVPAGASSGVFAGFYPPGAAFGAVTVSFTT